MSATIFEAFIPLAQDLRNRPDGEYLTAFALKYFFTHHRIEMMTDLQKAEHKRVEHDRTERHEAAFAKDAASRDRAGRSGREPRRDRDRDRGGRDRDRGERRPEREGRAPRTLEVDAVAPAAARVEAGEGADADRPQRARIFLSYGEQDGADEAKVREVVASLAPGLELRAVELRRGHTFLEVAPEALDGAVEALNGKDWNGKALAAEKARRRRR
jgi:ATP-dependent RNA helicase DeaD